MPNHAEKVPRDLWGEARGTLTDFSLSLEGGEREQIVFTTTTRHGSIASVEVRHHQDDARIASWSWTPEDGIQISGVSEWTVEALLEGLFPGRVLAEKPFRTYSVEWSQEDGVFVARVAEFPYLAAHGDTSEGALKELKLVVSTIEQEQEDEQVVRGADSPPQLCTWTKNGARP